MVIIRMNETTVECSITAEELREIGLTPEAILKGDSNTLPLMEELNKEVISQLSFDPQNEVLMMSRGPIAGGGIRIHAVKMRNDDIQKVADQAREAAWKVIDTVTQERVDEIKNESGVKKGEALNAMMHDVSSQIASVYETAMEAGAEEGEDGETPTITRKPAMEYTSYLACFENLRDAARFARAVTDLPIEDSALYKEDDFYYLHMGLRTSDYQEVYTLRIQAMEFAEDLWINAPVEAHIQETGEVLIKEDAISRLLQL